VFQWKWVGSTGRAGGGSTVVGLTAAYPGGSCVSAPPAATAAAASDVSWFWYGETM